MARSAQRSLAVIPLGQSTVSDMGEEVRLSVYDERCEAGGLTRDHFEFRQKILAKGLTQIGPKISGISPPLSGALPPEASKASPPWIATLFLFALPCLASAWTPSMPGTRRGDRPAERSRPTLGQKQTDKVAELKWSFSDGCKPRGNEPTISSLGSVV